MWIALLTLATPAWPCAGIVHDDGVLAESDGAEVLFEPGASSTTVTYEVSYYGDAADFGWVIPIPGAFVDLADGSVDLFAELRGITAPRVEWFEEASEGGGGCLTGSSKSDGGGENALGADDAQNEVTVVGEGFTGTYAYTVLEAGSVAALEAWMAENAWSSGLDPQAAQHYVDAGHAFVLVEILPSSSDTLPPLRLTYSGSELSFPSVMAQSASAPAQRTTVYVQGDSGATVSAGWAEDDEPTLYGDANDLPEDVFEAWLTRIGADRTWARTYTGPYDGDTLTRFDTLAPASVHDRDAVFALADVGDTHLTVILGEEGGGQAALWLLPLAALAGMRRRRSPGRR